MNDGERRRQLVRSVGRTRHVYAIMLLVFIVAVSAVAYIAHHATHKENGFHVQAHGKRHQLLANPNESTTLVTGVEDVQEKISDDVDGKRLPQLRSFSRYEVSVLLFQRKHSIALIMQEARSPAIVGHIYIYIRKPTLDGMR